MFHLPPGKEYKNLYLNCHSVFSLRYGTLTVDALAHLAQTHQIEYLALTDIHSTSACYDFARACRKAGISPVIGMEFRKAGNLLYVAIARNLTGFHEICQFYSDYTTRHQDFPELPPAWSNVFVIYPWTRQDRSGLGENEFLGIRADQVPELLRSRYRHRQDRLVVLQPLTFTDKRGHNLHRLLRAIDQNVILSKLPASSFESLTQIFIPPGELSRVFADYPQILKNTETLLARCSFEVDFNQNRTRSTFTGGKYEDMLLLEKLVFNGLEKRYGKHHAEARKRVEKELNIIDQLDFNAYFLITWDFVNYGRSQGFFHVGRGSGANSVAAYCLGITDVDPLELNLYFERFLNPRRKSPPDFDIDYSWKDRDEVIDYVFRRYRHSHTALLATYNTFQDRSAIRELGKVFGLPKTEIDELVHLAHYEKLPADMGKIQQQIITYAHLLMDVPNHLSIHAGGVLISEAPITQYTALDLPPKGFQITHFDMHVAEEIGLHKFDILSQRGLGHIRETVEIVRENQQISVDIHQVGEFKQDKAVKNLLAKGQTTGCFYVESPAMRQLLQKLGCTDYPGLVAASSIIRPGVARSGMMRAYIARHNGESFACLHPHLEELLSETYGIMVYQEDVLKVVHGFAGLSLAEADLLRRAMSGKSRSGEGFQVVKENFFTACREKGYAEGIVQELWRQIESFAGYSFSKAHSASFAVESFQSLYLKAHFPLEFMVGVINNFGGFYDAEIYLHEARMAGAVIHPPCVNHSRFHTRIIGKDIYLGFIHLKSLPQKTAEEIPLERKRRGKFRDMADFVQRVPVSQEQMEILIRAGAFQFTGKSKYTLLWEMDYQLRHQKIRQPDVLFVPVGESFSVPDLPVSLVEDAWDEMELLGFPLCSPFELAVPRNENTPLLSRQFAGYLHQEVEIMGYYVCAKTTRTIRGELMMFANFLDSEGRFFDATLFPEVAKKSALTGRGLYLMRGKVVEEFGHYSLEITTISKYLYQPDPRQE
ncbi:MAG: DNA polymerase III subunit alpha [Bacteroidia bacterium]